MRKSNLIYLNRAAYFYHNPKPLPPQKTVDMTYLIKPGNKFGLLIDRHSFDKVLKSQFEGIVKHFKVNLRTYRNIVETHQEYLNVFELNSKVKNKLADKKYI